MEKATTQAAANAGGARSVDGSDSGIPAAKGRTVIVFGWIDQGWGIR
jgi:hypothetical protein